MADPATYRPRTRDIPDSPGVYRFRDEAGRVIYVGKAKNLRSRLTSYFQDPAALHRRTAQMVSTAASVDWTIVSTEVEALALEYTWIKEFEPRFNVRYRDDKSYPYLAVTMGEEFPRIMVMRGAKRRGTRYFGPYGHAWAIRETVDLLLRVFPVRTCSAGVFRRAQLAQRTCLLGDIDKCSAPCVGWISPADHRRLAEDFCTVMAGAVSPFITRLETQMREAAEALDFERAAKLRDDLTALRLATEKNAIVLADGTNADLFGLVGDELEAAVQVFYVRDGRIRGERGWVVEKVEELDDPALVERLLQQVYGAGESDAVPAEVLVPVLPTNHGDLVAWLSELRGSRVSIRVPKRGPKAELAETVQANAGQALALHRTRRAGDLTTRSQALRELQDALELAEPPLRIECYDISTTMGTFQVGSMVVFEDGLARKSEYRSFNIRGADVRDDASAIAEVLRRRFAPGRVAQEGFAYEPSLIIVDGGQVQVNAAAAVLADVGEDVALIGLAERFEEVWLPHTSSPVILERGSQGLYLLQRVRDEAHRFAITKHRARRGRAMTASILDEIPGLGPVRQKKLMRVFKSVARLRAATESEIAAVPGFGPVLASSVWQALHGGNATVISDGESSPSDGTVTSSYGTATPSEGAATSSEATTTPEEQD
jgi:excinuclease ABC subunit C